MLQDAADRPSSSYREGNGQAVDVEQGGPRGSQQGSRREGNGEEAELSTPPDFAALSSDLITGVLNMSTSIKQTDPAPLHFPYCHRIPPVVVGQEAKDVSSTLANRLRQPPRASYHIIEAYAKMKRIRLLSFVDALLVAGWVFRSYYLAIATIVPLFFGVLGSTFFSRFLLYSYAILLVPILLVRCGLFALEPEPQLGIPPYVALVIDILGVCWETIFLFCPLLSFASMIMSVSLEDLEELRQRQKARFGKTLNLR
uniref:Transmembrane protein n=1 Tax=Chromera velia CCMP2878 TaxID=1169474 RepID=A0A0G4I3R1_9ALVE|mmetsp:Transcript_3059/g.6228  ORF Transcript_3059/g.6228 Transcript_3059/m.6228 type:complete len:256 (-) Transcript_3059:89-856(-)|eukprot:Cvel_10663.t1-p1 / transcript=Cvel_10663.t1 / gene=Cvel_10663 / organism=Chromera_velia_CCMP2878 / gene_product=hypothetical protein / transcript_product=hypothetical protein / location=Cvel_scaffold648:36415-37179(-) / protein_length=255 / sequence_SO=supercontig / SO=protein_coding / is_pseudo=false